jgi:hypothetical protein
MDFKTDALSLGSRIQELLATQPVAWGNVIQEATSLNSLLAAETAMSGSLGRGESIASADIRLVQAEGFINLLIEAAQQGNLVGAKMQLGYAIERLSAAVVR